MKRILIFCALFLIYSSVLKAQQKVLNGRVFNQEGEVLPGANVISSDGQGVATNVRGVYRLNLSSDTTTVTVSYIGYKTLQQQVKPDDLANGAVLDVYLTAESVRLSDLVVTSDESINLEKIIQYDLTKRPIKNSQEVLRMIPGLFIAQHAGGGKAEQIFLRGFDIDHGTDINLSVDGLPVNMVSHAHGQGYSDLHFVIPETIEKVNFSKGPYDSDKGDFATAGQVEFQTYDRLPQSSVKLEGGQFSTLRTVALIDLLGKNKSKENAYLAGEVFLSDGYFESPQNFSRLNIMGKYNRRINDDIKVELMASHFYSKWDASGQIPERAIRSGAITRFGAIDDTEGGETSRTNASVKVIQNVGRSASWNNQVYFTDYKFDLFSNFTFFLNNPQDADQIRQREHRQIYGYNTDFLTENRVGEYKLTSKVGAGIRHDNIGDIRLSNTLNRNTVLSDAARGDVDQTNYSVWMDETLDINERLSFNASVRLDYFRFAYNDHLRSGQQQKVAESIISPKMQLNYKLNDRINLFAKAGTGFHSNDARVAVVQNGMQILPKAYALDLGWQYKPTNNLMLTTVLWRLNLDQEFVYVGDEGIIEPSGKSERRGVDFSLRYEVNDRLYFDTDFTITEAKSLTGADQDDKIPLAPKLTGTGGVNFQFNSDLSTSLRYRYLGARPANEDYSVTAEGYFLLDAVINYARPKFDISLSIENVLNTDWKEAQFLTESRLQNELDAVEEIHFTPGTPLFAKMSVRFLF